MRKNKSVLKSFYKKERLVRYTQFWLGVIIVAGAFNLFILPSKLVYGVSGLAVILNYTNNLDPSLVILVSSVFLLILSYFFLGKEKTKNSILGSLVYPVMVKLTSNIGSVIDISQAEPLVIILFGAVITGFGLGLIFKAGYTTGGTDILNQIVAKYFKISMGNSMFFTDGLLIFSSAFILGWTRFMYSIITLYIISIMTDKVILGISQSKVFYIITEHETAVKKFIMSELNHGVTVLDARGGFTGNNQKVIMCIIPTREYYVFKEAILEIDPEAFLVASDAYETLGGA